MWQSRVETKGYSIAYFNCLAEFEARIAELPLRAGLIGTLWTYYIYNIYEVLTSPKVQ